MDEIPKDSLMDVLIRVVGIDAKEESSMEESQNKENLSEEFHGIAEKVVAEIEKRGKVGGVTSQELEKIVSKLVGRKFGPINCYPGTPADKCYRLAFFISLSSPRYAKGRGHLYCGEAMEKIVQHMQGSCPEQTDYAVLISDSWYAVAFDEWKPNLEQIKKKAKLAIYLMVGGRASLIKL